MSSYFEKKLIDLLPPLYKVKDESGDLDTFLRVPAESLDDLKDLADRFPEIFDVNRCDPRFLPFLSRIVGVTFDPLRDADLQRRAVREAIEVYRRKGSIPAITRTLVNLGWEGSIEETFRKALRLNRRCTIGRAKLPGLLYSLGVYRIHSENIVQGIKPSLVFHHPAGTRVYFLQWLYSMLSMEGNFEVGLWKEVQRVCLAFLDETFVLNRNLLNSDFHLTLKGRTAHFWGAVQGTSITQEIDSAAVCLFRWHGRTPCFRLNTIPLNSKRLAHLWITERKFAVCCQVDTKRPPETPVPVIRMAGQDLNTSRLNRSKAACRIKFRQRDVFSEALAQEAQVEANGRVHVYQERANLSSWFRLGHSELNGLDRVSGAWVGRHQLITALAVFKWAEVREAHDVVDRWRARRAGFSLNNRVLNTTELTDAYVTAARASFELDVDTEFGRRRRIKPLCLNTSDLNQTSLRLTVDRTDPMRLGTMKLNRAGFRVVEKHFRWRFRQHDDHAKAQATVEQAANLYTVTQWPT